MSRSDSFDLGDHICVLTSTAEQRLATMLAVAADGLAGGQMVMVLSVSPPPAAVEEVLTERIDGAAAGLDSGQLQVLPARELYLADHRFNPRVFEAMAGAIDGALAAGYSGLRVAADMTWAVSPSVDTAGLADYEAAVNALALDGRAFGACLYERRGMDPGLMRSIIQSHPATTRHPPVAPQLRMRRTYRPYGIAFHGEADISNRNAVQSALNATLDARPDNCSELVLDVSELHFADVSVAAAVSSLATRTSGLVRIVGCHGVVALLFQHLGLNDTSGVKVSPSEPCT
ncbi:MEDS domain-containing protein [Cryptosporangium sp. NPDC051539]|uniref:MEDS domain-containing protein n=1 Tax=Cryptosporangium sp. NPDC051539 TaxID=3363962 RepID=UPI00378D8ED4